MAAFSSLLGIGNFVSSESLMKWRMLKSSTLGRICRLHMYQYFNEIYFLLK